MIEVNEILRQEAANTTAWFIRAHQLTRGVCPAAAIVVRPSGRLAQMSAYLRTHTYCFFIAVYKS